MSTLFIAVGAKTWASIAGDLPDRGTVYCLAEDHVRPDLLFCGTEFGLYVTLDGGKKWQRLKNGLPTINVKDLTIQRGQNDLVVGTFGRGIYILDDYSPLRDLDAGNLRKEAHLFPIRDAVQYVPTRQYGDRGKAFLGDAFFTADNPPYGAVFTYHLEKSIKTLKQKRRDAEKNPKAPPFPSKDELRAEAEEEEPAILLTINDAEGKEVRTLTGPVTAGMHRVSWDLHRASASGPPVPPGAYKVALAKRVDGVTIGDRAIVGAGAVVREAVAEGAIVVGIPARVVGQRS